MEEFKLIEFQKTRDFSNKMNATFMFVRQNIIGLGRSMLFIAGPPVLIASLLISNFFKDFFGLSMQSGQGDPAAFAGYFTSVSFWAQLALMMVFAILATILMTSISYNYMVLYRERKSSQIEVNEVWEKVKDTLWMYLSTAFIFALLAMCAYILMVVPIVLLAAVSPLLIFFGVLLIIIAIFYLAVSFSLIFVVRTFEPIGIFEALGRSYRLVQGKWWSTFGLLMILNLIVGTISSIFFLPAYIILITQSLHNIESGTYQPPSDSTGTIILVFMTLYYLCQLVLSCLPNIGLAFQYFNLVELKEAKGLMGQLENFGQPKGPDSPAGNL